MEKLASFLHNRLNSCIAPVQAGLVLQRTAKGLKIDTQNKPQRELESPSSLNTLWERTVKTRIAIFKNAVL